MIARIWEGRTKNEHSDLYTNIIVERDIPGYKKTLGFIKHTFLKRVDSEFTHFKLLTFWSDKEAISSFTGPNIEEAKYYHEDEQYLLDFPGSVFHYEVFSD